MAPRLDSEAKVVDLQNSIGCHFEWISCKNSYWTDIRIWTDNYLLVVLIRSGKKIDRRRDDLAVSFDIDFTI